MTETRLLTRRAALSLAPGALLAASATAEAGPGLGKQRRDLRQAIERALADHLEKRREAEGITGIVAHASLATDPRGVIACAGTVSRESKKKMGPRTLFQIGSNTKSFTAAILLKLEAAGLCSIDQTVGDWLPEYPAWGDVSIKRLLDMTSGIPTYSDAPRFMEAQVADINRHWTPEELVAFAYPGPDNDLPTSSGYFYSNTNYILAGMIAAKAGGATYDYLLETMLFQPVRLHDSFYSSSATPRPALRRLASGYWENPECGVYEQGCTSSILAPLLGQDMRTADLSWAGAAGGIIATPRELTRWVRALFGGEVLAAKQLTRMQTLVSTATGKPITETTADEPRGFGLGVIQMYRQPFGRFWFYEGMTLGYRGVFGWFPDKDLVISFCTNSQPDPSENQTGVLMGTLYDICTGATT